VSRKQQVQQAIRFSSSHRPSSSTNMGPPYATGYSHVTIVKQCVLQIVCRVSYLMRLSSGRSWRLSTTANLQDSEHTGIACQVRSW
jgi:hypothetical protein